MPTLRIRVAAGPPWPRYTSHLARRRKNWDRVGWGVNARRTTPAYRAAEMLQRLAAMYPANGR